MMNLAANKRTVIKYVDSITPTVKQEQEMVFTDKINTVHESMQTNKQKGEGKVYVDPFDKYFALHNAPPKQEPKQSVKAIPDNEISFVEKVNKLLNE